MPLNPADLADALTDVKSAVQGGESFDDALDSASADYGLARGLIERKFRESYGDPIDVFKAFQRASAGRPDPFQIAALVKDKVRKLCEHHRVPYAKTFERTIRGKKYTLIIRAPFASAPEWIAVRHEDQEVVRVGGLNP